MKKFFKFCNTLLLMFSMIGIASCSNYAAPIVNGWQQSAGKRSHYIVQKGDTLYSVAWAFDLDYRYLAKINHLTPTYALYRGQILYMSPRFAVRKLTTRATALPPPRKSLNKFATNTTTPVKIPLPANKMGPVKQWLWPVKGKIIKRFSLTSGGTKGIEIAGYVGEPIVASAPGRVVYSGSGLRGYGNLIIIKHNNNFLSAYAYNKTLLVKEGMLVTAGQKIALMGNNSAGRICLHFEIRRNGKPINPLQSLQ